MGYYVGKCVGIGCANLIVFREVVMYSTHEILSEVRSSGVLGKSERQYNLLKYLLEKQEQKLTGEIKAYSIALDVFGRSDNFESSQDSIVRVEMFRLRKNLKAFNSTSKNFTLRLPQKSYFIEIAKKQLKTKPTKFFDRQKIILFSLLIPVTTLLMSGMVYWLSHPQMKYSSLCSYIIPNVAVVTKQDIDPIGSIVYNGYVSALDQQTSVNLIEPTKICSSKLTPFYQVHIDSLYLKRNVNISITTSLSKSDEVIHSTVIDEGPLKEQTNNALFYTAVRAANDLGKMNGIIPRHAGRLKWGAKSARTNYNCLIAVYDSFVTNTDEDYIKPLECLEKAMDEEVPPIASVGALSVLYLSQNRGGRPKTVENPFIMAKQLLDTVGDSWIDDVETVMAKIYFDAEQDGYSSERLKDTLNISETHYSLNPQVLVTASVIYGFRLGDWEHAKNLSDLVKLIHSERDSSVLIVDAVYALLTLPPDKVMENCLPAVSQYSISSNIIIHTCALMAGDKKWVEKTRMNLQNLGFENSDDIIQFVVDRPYDPVLVSKITETLH